MPNSTTDGTRVVLSLWENGVKCKYNYEEDADLNHRLRRIRKYLPLLVKLPVLSPVLPRGLEGECLQRLLAVFSIRRGREALLP